MNPMKRIGILLVLGASSACSRDPDASLVHENQQETVFCSLAGAKEFTGQCAFERASADGKTIVVVRHPDGGFRRFEITKDNNGLITADGADEAGVAPNDTLLDVRVGEDRYRFPLGEVFHAPAQ